MENESRRKFVNNGIIIGGIVCCVGLLIPSVNIAMGGVITMCLAQIVDIVWHLMERKFKDCKNIKQAFCRCRDIEIINEWDGVETKFARCVKCGKYIMLNERLNSMIIISEEEYKHHVEMFNVMNNSMENINKILGNLEIDFKGLFEKKEEHKEKNE